MSEMDVRIVELPPMRMATAWAFSDSPETAAWELMHSWAEPLGYLDQNEPPRIFGFNNPDPSPGSPNYGYEFWMTIEEDIPVAGDIRLHSFGGGLYAVTRCVGIPAIPQTWKQLVVWLQKSKYRKAHHQWLEEHISFMKTPLDQYILDLFLPIMG